MHGRLREFVQRAENAGRYHEGTEQYRFHQVLRPMAAHRSQRTQLRRLHVACDRGHSLRRQVRRLCQQVLLDAIHGNLGDLIPMPDLSDSRSVRKRCYSWRVQNHSVSADEKNASAGRSRGLTAVGIFLFFGGIMALLAGITLTWPGTGLDKIWIANPTAYAQLQPLGWKVGILFLALSVALVAAGVGWFQRRAWGWKLAVAIITTQVLGDLINLLRGDVFRGGVGFTIAAALLLYLVSREVRAAFLTSVAVHPRASGTNAG